MKRLRKPPLTQAQIDRPELPKASRRTASWREALEWLESEPQGIATSFMVILFLALILVALWAAFKLF